MHERNAASKEQWRDKHESAKPCAGEAIGVDLYNQTATGGYQRL